MNDSTRSKLGGTCSIFTGVIEVVEKDCPYHRLIGKATEPHTLLRQRCRHRRRCSSQTSRKRNPRPSR
jgi:hypothetical protein